MGQTRAEIDASILHPRPLPVEPHAVRSPAGILAWGSLSLSFFSVGCGNAAPTRMPCQNPPRSVRTTSPQALGPPPVG